MREMFVALDVSVLGGVAPHSLIGGKWGVVFFVEFICRHEELRVIAMRLQVMSASQVHPIEVGVR